MTEINPNYSHVKLRSGGVVIAEISLIPLTNGKVSMSDEIAVAFKAIKKTKGLRVTLTRMGTQVEPPNLKTILDVVEVAYDAVTKVGASRIIFTVPTYQRLDKMHRHKLAST